jgi:hypothetical protein
MDHYAHLHHEGYSYQDVKTVLKESLNVAAFRKP